MSNHQPHPGPSPFSSLTYRYAIRFPDGLYYYGPTWDTSKANKDTAAIRIAQPHNRGPLSHFFTYAEPAAYKAIAIGGPEFECCTVERVL